MTAPFAATWTGVGCSIPGCASPKFAKGYCRVHYERKRRHGSPHVLLVRLSPRGAPTAWIKANADHDGTECLIWPFSRLPDGRTHMHLGGRHAIPARVMCAIVHGPPPSAVHQAAHSCGKGHDGCVNPTHLRWATPKENAADKVEHGTLLRGEQLPQAKLTADAVREIRRLHGSMLQREIAERFGVKIMAINKIVNGKAWRHVQ